MVDHARPAGYRTDNNVERHSASSSSAGRLKLHEVT